MMNIMNVKLSEGNMQVQNNRESKPVGSYYSEVQKEKIAKASKQFEGLLTSMMLKSMKQTTNALSDDKDQGFGSDMFDSIFQSQMSSYISNNKSLGIADLVYKKITGENMNELNLNNHSIHSFDFKYKGTSFSPGLKSINKLEKYNDIIDDASKTYGVDKNLIKAVVLAESAGNTNAVSSAKAKGLMQLIDSTAKDMGVKNIWDPKENIFGGTKYLSQLLQKFNGNVEKALAGYNAGPAKVEQFNGIPPYEETKNYVARVIGYLNNFNG